MILSDKTNHEHKHFPALDGLRGATAMFVLFAHVCSQTGLLPDLIDAQSAQVGVQIFFALSGFLMGFLYLDRPLDVSGIRDYIARRVGRVIPMYTAIVMASFASTQLFGFTFAYAIDGSNIIDHIFLIRATSVLWTVPAEVFFYAAFPLVWLGFRLSKAIGEFALLCAIFLSYMGYIPLPWSTHTLAFFLVGVAASRSVLRPQSTALFLAALLLEFLMLGPVWESLGNAPFNIWKSPTNLIAAGAVVLAATESTAAKYILGNPVMRFFGRISYSVYLLHWPIMSNMTIFTDIEKYPVVYLILVALATILVATITYHLIEAPARRYCVTRIAARPRQVRLHRQPRAL